jgi:S1-C subfamily serine protease
MSRIRSLLCSAVAGMALSLVGYAFAQDQFSTTADQVNKKMVKLFGSGGFKGLASYGTGIIVSPEGHVLTVASTMLDTQNLRAHLPDGRRFDNLQVLGVEPTLDLAIVKIPGAKDLPYFDVGKAAQRTLAETGDWVLAFSNQFQIATRDEPMTVQKGVVSAISKLQGRRGIFEAPYTGDVYVIDAITNNPGAGGGALVTRKGELLGIIGKELRNTLTDTWINYAVPVQAKLEVQVAADKKKTISVAEFVETTIREGKWQKLEVVIKGGPRGHHGIRLVQDVVERTPPYIDDVLPNSPAAKVGLKVDDLIVYVNGEQVVSVKLFTEIMNKMGPGTKVSVEVRRGDKLRTFELELKEPAAKVVTPKN